MASRKFCKVDITWCAGSNSTVNDVVIYNIESDSYEDNSKLQNADAVDLFLVPPKNQDENEAIPCTATITCTDAGDNLAIAAVDILSNARNIEVFSPTGEYLITAEGIKLDVAGERKLFLSQHTFDVAQSMCTLKFVSLVEPQKLWLHSLHITLGKNTSQQLFPLQMGPMIDMDKVSNMVADMDGEIPDRAKGLMTAITSMQKSKENTIGSLGGFLGNSGGGGRGGGQGMSGLIGMFASMGLMSGLSQPKPEPPVQLAPDVPKSRKSRNKKNKKDKAQKKAAQEEKKESGGHNGTCVNGGQTPSEEKQNKGGKKQSNGQNIQKPDSAQETQTRGKKRNKKKKRHKEEPTPAACTISPPNNLSEHSESSDANDIQTVSTCSSESAPKELTDLQALEQRLCARIKATEENLRRDISEQIAASEHRIIDHINGLVGKLSTVLLGGLPVAANGSGDRDSHRLDLD